MLKCTVMLIAQGVVRDAETNNMSVFNILEELTPETLPALITNTYALMMLERDKGDAEIVNCQFQISSADTVIFSQELEINFQGKLRTRSVGLIGALPIMNPGPVVYMLSTQNEILAQYQVDVNNPRQQKAPVVQDG